MSCGNLWLLLSTLEVIDASVISFSEFLFKYFLNLSKNYDLIDDHDLAWVATTTCWKSWRECFLSSNRISFFLIMILIVYLLQVYFWIFFQGNNFQNFCLVTGIWKVLQLLITAQKVSKYGVISGPYISIFGLNKEIYGKSPYSVRIQENTNQK